MELYSLLISVINQAERRICWRNSWGRVRKDVRFLPAGVVVDFLGVAFLLFVVGRIERFSSMMLKYLIRKSRRFRGIVAEFAG